MPTLVDILILCIISFSATLALRRGPIREGLSLSAWVIAILIAFKMAVPMSQGLSHHVADEQLRWLLAVLLVFTPALLGFSLANAYTCRNLKPSTASYAKALALGLGTLRGIAIIFLAIILGRFADLNQDYWWHKSSLIYKMETLSAYLEPYLQTPLHPSAEQASPPTITRRLVLQADEQGAFHAQGYVNDIAVSFRLDPNAEKTGLPQSLASELALSQDAKAGAVLLPSITIGNLTLREVHATFDPNHQGEQIVLGQNVLQRLNFQGGALQLTLEQAFDTP